MSVGVIAFTVDVDDVIDVIEGRENNKNTPTAKIHFIAESQSTFTAWTSIPAKKVILSSLSQK